jgi:hypothetical protein
MTAMRVRPLVVCGLWLLAAGGLMASGRALPLVADDAYYYFEIARNAALGHGFTFDGLAPTNGFHPLWAWILVPIFRIFPTSEFAPIYVALALSAVFMVATALLLVRLFARHGAPLSGEIAAYAWLFNPFGVSLALRAMEGPLNALLLAVSISTLDSVRGRGRYSVRDLAVLGVTVGLAMLARTDNILWLGTVGLVLAWDLVRRRVEPRRMASGLASIGAAILAVMSPWLLWNLAAFGTVVQSSLEAKQLFNLYGELPPLVPAGVEGIGVAGSALYGFGRNLGIMGQSAFRYAAVEEWTQPYRAYRLMALVAAYAVAVALAAFIFRRRMTAATPGLGTLATHIGPAIAIFFVAHFVGYALAFGSYSNWYFLPPVLVASIGLGFAMGWVAGLPPRWGRAIVLGQAVLLAVLTYTFTRGHFHTRRDERERVLRVGGALAPGTRIGLWNAGLVGYVFSFHFPDRPVINLDGVVNNVLVRRARAGQYEQYVLEHVDVVIEAPSMFVRVLGQNRADAFAAQHVRVRGKAGSYLVSDVIR